MPVDRLKEVDDRLSDSERLGRIKNVLDAMLPAVLLLLLGAIYMETFVPLTRAMEVWVVRAEQAVVLYFVAELVVDLAIYEDNRAFLQDRWLDILLVTPFVAVANGAARFLNAAAVKSAKLTKLLKGTHIGHLLRKRRALKEAKIVQHAGKGAKKARDLAED